MSCTLWKRLATVDACAFFPLTRYLLRPPMTTWGVEVCVCVCVCV